MGRSRLARPPCNQRVNICSDEGLTLETSRKLASLMNYSCKVRVRRRRPTVVFTGTSASLKLFFVPITHLLASVIMDVATRILEHNTRMINSKTTSRTVRKIPAVDKNRANTSRSASFSEIVIIHCFFSLHASFARNTSENAKVRLKTRMTVLKMRITCKQNCDQYLCEVWFAECALFRFQS